MLKAVAGTGTSHPHIHMYSYTGIIASEKTSKSITLLKIFNFFSNCREKKLDSHNLFTVGQVIRSTFSLGLTTLHLQILLSKKYGVLRVHVFTTI